MDSESIAAALLHDVVEDTPTTLDDLKAAFGEEVALLGGRCDQADQDPVLQY